MADLLTDEEVRRVRETYIDCETRLNAKEISEEEAVVIMRNTIEEVLCHGIARVAADRMVQQLFAGGELNGMLGGLVR